MILVLADDLLIASKIRTASAAAGVDVAVAPSLDEAVAKAGGREPRLVMLDLDSKRVDALAALARMKDDPRLSRVPTLGFVSHVRADRIAAARAAGVGRVMARSAFVRDLQRLLAEPAFAGQEPDTGAPYATPPSAEDVREAARKLAGHVRRTPLVSSDWLSGLAGAPVHLKLESLQVTGSFKARGTMHACLEWVEREGASAGEPPTIVTASAGNAGRALAWAAERLGLRAIVFTPRDAPRTKLDAIRRHGADLRAEAATYEDAERLAKAFARDNRLPWLSPYSHPDVIAGAATVGLEILEELPAVGTILVPLGGGGLLAGIASAVKAISPAVRVVGIEAARSPAFSTSLGEGRIVEVNVGPSIADGLAGNMDPETITFEMIRDLADQVVVAEEDHLRAAVRGLVDREHLIAEGAGAAGVAAILSGSLETTGEIAVVVSGSNIDSERLCEVVTEGLRLKA